METNDAQIPDSPSKNSYIGSYYQPPEKITPMAGQLGLPAHSVVTDPRMPRHTNKIDNRAVVNALKNLQQKINRMDLEKKEAETNCQQLSHNNVPNHQEVSSVYTAPGRSVSHQPGPGRSDTEEYTLKLQSVEARCKILEKQLNHMRKMVENGNKEREAVIEKRSLLQNQQPNSSDIKSQHEKLERMETLCLELSRTQALAETKLSILEEKLLKEECECLLVQEKADQLQKEVDTDLHRSAHITEEKNAQESKTTKKSPRVPLPSGTKHKKMPFVAGKSTSPSHSVHANVQGILHMMKHHQPWLCEQVSALHKSTGGIKKNLYKEFSSTSTNNHARELKLSDRSLGFLSDLLLALQDELGQMSFEHQELLEEIDVTQHREEREDLKSELERLVTRMEEKGAQITKLRKHWKMVHNLMQDQRGHEGNVSKNNAIRPPVPSPVKLKQKGINGGPKQNNLQLLRETHKFRNNLKRDDISWET